MGTAFLFKLLTVIAARPFLDLFVIDDLPRRVK
jgi:hypothetical protein